MSVKIRRHRGNIVLEIDWHQRRRYITIGPDTEANQKKAEKKAEEWEIGLRLYGERMFGPKVKHDCPTFKQYATEWLEKSKLKQSTLQSYRTNLTKHLIPVFGPFRLNEITVRAVRRFLETKARETYPVLKTKKPTRNQIQTYRQYSKDAIRLMRATLRTIFEDAVLDEHVSVNPVSPRKLAKIYEDAPTHEEKRPFSLQERNEFERKVQKRHLEYYELVMVLGRAGLRLGEALALERGDIDLKKLEIHVTKSLSPGRRLSKPKSKRSRRVVMMSEGLAEALADLFRRQREEWMQKGKPMPDRIFHNTTGGKVLYGKFLKRFKQLQSGSLLRTPHDLRHTFASIHLQSGAAVEWVSAQLGHANVAITYRIYAHWIPDTKADRNQANRIDGNSFDESGLSGNIGDATKDVKGSK